MRVSLSGFLAVTLAGIAVIGGWYKFDYRISTQEQVTVELLKRDQAHSEAEARIADTLNKTNNVLGRITQALDDKDGIKIKEQ